MMHGPEFTADEVIQFDRSVDNTNSSYASKKRRSKSKVWDEFTPVLNGQIAECIHCKKRLSGKSSGGTSHLHRHLKICAARPGSNRRHQEGSSSESLEELPRATISDLGPLSTMSSSSFRQVLAGMYPTSNMISQVETEEQFICMFHNERLKLKDKIALAPGGVFLSVKRWELKESFFLSLAVHFIDEEWKVHNCIIRCSCSELEDAECYLSMLPDWETFMRHSNRVQSYSNRVEVTVIRMAVEEWSLREKLLGIAGAESVDKAVIFDLEENLTGQNYLITKCKLPTIPCSIDALHGFFGDYPTENIMETSKIWFHYMTCSPLRKKKYQEVVSQMCLNRPSFNSKRWYSTFYLLEAVLQFNKALPNPVLMDSVSYPTKPSPRRLEEVETFCLTVRPIYHSIRVLSSSCCTANSYFHALWNVREALQASSQKRNIECILSIGYMMTKFDAHWRKSSWWMSVAVVLDPRYKLGFLEYCFKKAYGDGAKMYIFEVRGKIYDLFLRYSCRSDQPSGNVFQMNTYDSDPLHDTSQNYNERAALEEFKELHVYLEGEICHPIDVRYLRREPLSQTGFGYPREGFSPQSQNGHFDILKWWKDNAAVYPTLARLARDVLAIPGCAVSAESAFDETDERVFLFNRKLSPEIVEAVICTQDWFKDSGTSNADAGSCNMPT